MKRLSIILPIYNVEKYLESCINSIIKQSGFETYEVLLINDGSSDSSGYICDKYARNFSNIKAFHKENGGLSDARNYGLSKATGEYVLFVNYDDCLEINSLKELIIAASDSNCDILLADACCINETGNKINEKSNDYKHRGLVDGKIYTGEEAIDVQLMSGRFQTTVWLGVYRRNFLFENKLWFEKGILHEDELWTPRTMLLAKNVLYKEICFYQYRIRENSIMRSTNKNYTKNIQSLLYIFNKNERLYIAIKNETLKRRLLDDWARRYLHAIALWNFTNYPNLLSKVDKRQIVKNSISMKNVIRAYIFYINPKLYSWLMQRLMRMI